MNVFNKTTKEGLEQGKFDKLFNEINHNVYEYPFISKSTLDNEIIGRAKENKYVSKMIQNLEEVNEKEMIEVTTVDKDRL